jgi:hypothetical protein
MAHGSAGGSPGQVLIALRSLEQPRQFGRICILVNNAVISPGSKMEAFRSMH